MGFLGGCLLLYYNTMQIFLVCLQMGYCWSSFIIWYSNQISKTKTVCKRKKIPTFFSPLVATFVAIFILSSLGQKVMCLINLNQPCRILWQLLLLLPHYVCFFLLFFNIVLMKLRNNCHFPLCELNVQELMGLST